MNTVEISSRTFSWKKRGQDVLTFILHQYIGTVGIDIFAGFLVGYCFDVLGLSENHFLDTDRDALLPGSNWAGLAFGVVDWSQSSAKGDALGLGPTVDLSGVRINRDSHSGPELDSTPLPSRRGRVPIQTLFRMGLRRSASMLRPERDHGTFLYCCCLFDWRVASSNGAKAFSLK